MESNLTDQDLRTLVSFGFPVFVGGFYFLAFKYSRMPRYILWTNFVAAVLVVVGFVIMLNWSHGVGKMLLGPGAILWIISIFLR